jgi:hypothetical protein
VWTREQGGVLVANCGQQRWWSQRSDMAEFAEYDTEFRACAERLNRSVTGTRTKSPLKHAAALSTA